MGKVPENIYKELCKRVGSSCANKVLESIDYDDETLALRMSQNRLENSRYKKMLRKGEDTTEYGMKLNVSFLIQEYRKKSVE